MDLSIITVTYQSKQYIDSCILSLASNLIKSTYEHIIVDNGSTDGTIELIESGYSNYVRLIKNGTNLGFARANHRGLQASTGRLILFLNPDMQIHEGSLDRLLEWIERQQGLGIASCKLLNGFKFPNPTLRPFKFPSLFPYFLSFLGIKPFFCTTNPKFYYPSFNDDEEQEVDVVRGSFMLMKREVIERVGFPFDPRYFLLFEDVDLCREIKKIGLKVMYFPALSCIDFNGQSFSFHTLPWKYLQVARSFKIYVSKWHCPLHLIWIHLAIAFGYLARIGKWGLRHSWNALIAPRPMDRKMSPRPVASDKSS